ncbi:MAG: hypothetical protein LBI02_02520 [Opitutaceae bacterium]|jgi:hypothetical protein|nr:hypothetical protein [Opitutaceae bacterium]
MPNLRATYRKLAAIDLERRHLPWCLALGLLSACMFGKYLVSASQVLSAPGTDSFAYYIYTYKLAFEGFANGDLVLWNPYNYGGQPFLGQMQSALFYPPNWLVAWMPVAAAMNWLVFGHQWLLGLGIYGWSASRGHRPAGAFLAAALMMFGAPYMLHAYAGHMSNLASMAWIPFIFWGIDGWLAKRDYRWLLLAAASAALQIYAGHSQYFYYTAIVAGLYSLVFLRPVAGKPRALLGLLLIWPVALALAAAQFLPGLAAASESVRAGGATREFAAMFAFPPENILTLLAPWLFGDMSAAAPYWGRCYLWEMSLYFGAAGLLLALNGLAAERGRRRLYAILFAAIALLALGSRTPLYDILYHALPGFSMFRGTSKFIFFLVMFLALLAGRGLDELLAAKKAPRWLYTGALALGIATLLFAAASGTGFWENAARKLAAIGQKTGEYYLSPKFFEETRHKVTQWNISDGGARYQVNDTVKISDADTVFVVTKIDRKTGKAVKITPKTEVVSIPLDKKQLPVIPVASNGAGLTIDVTTTRVSIDTVPRLSLALAGLALAAAGALLLAARRQTRLAWAIGAVALTEVLLVARQSIASFPSAEAAYPAIKEFLAKNQGDYRTLNMLNPESAIELKSEGIWGYDPFVLKRYAEFVHYANGLSPDRANQNIPKWEWRVPPMLAMLRGRLAFVPENNTIRVVPMQDPLPRFYVVANHRVLKNRDEIFAEMTKPGFNPRNEVLLEAPPVLAPDPGAGQYSIRLLNRSTDHWTLEVSTQFSAFLVMTDAYSKDWRVRSLPDPANPTLSSSVQVSYELLPAYHALRAIPLAPGQHRIRIEYAPGGLASGAKLTLASLLLSCLFLWVPCFKRAARALLNPTPPTPPPPPFN